MLQTGFRIRLTVAMLQMDQMIETALRSRSKIYGMRQLSQHRATGQDGAEKGVESARTVGNVEIGAVDYLGFSISNTDVTTFTHRPKIDWPGSNKHISRYKSAWVPRNVHRNLSGSELARSNL